MFKVYIQHTEPGLLVANSSGCRCHSLNGLGQQVNFNRERENTVRHIPCIFKDSGSSIKLVLWGFALDFWTARLDDLWPLGQTARCSPLASCPPASVNRALMTSSALQLLWPSVATCSSILRSTSSREAALSSSRMLAWAKNPSRSRWALTSSWKFTSFTYCSKKEEL